MPPWAAKASTATPARCFFGPVVSFCGVKHEARGRRAASQVDTRMMFIDDIDGAGAELPFGGIMNSGGKLGLQEFVDKKLVRSKPLPAPV